MAVGRKRAEILKDGALPRFLDNRLQGFEELTSARKHFASAHR